MQAELGKYAKSGGEREIECSDQLPLAATVPYEDSDECWTMLGKSSLDVSAILERAFLSTDTERGVGEPCGMSAAL